MHPAVTRSPLGSGKPCCALCLSIPAVKGMKDARSRSVKDAVASAQGLPGLSLIARGQTLSIHAFQC